MEKKKKFGSLIVCYDSFSFRFCAEESTMSRCKSPVAMRHERGSSADTGLIRIDNVSSNGGSTDDPNIMEDDRVRMQAICAK